MNRRDSVDIYSRTVTTGGQGQRVSTYAYLKTVMGNIQPYRLNELQAKIWGVTSERQDTRVLRIRPDTDIVALDRALFNGQYFEILAINQWPHHTVAVLVPTQGL